MKHSVSQVLALLILLHVFLLLYTVYQRLMLARPSQLYEGDERPSRMTTVHTNDLRTGDLLLFYGMERDSLIVRAWSNSLITHVGIVLRISGVVYVLNSDPGSDRVNFLSESTTDDSDKPRGVQLNRANLCLPAYKGLVLCRQLICFRGAKRPTVSPEFLRESSSKGFCGSWGVMLGGLYDQSAHPLGAAFSRIVLSASSINPADTYCSEFVRDVMQEMGILRPFSTRSKYAPRDFAKSALRGLDSRQYAYTKMRKITMT